MQTWTGTKRPIPSGKVNINLARGLMLALAAAGLAIAYFQSTTFLLLVVYAVDDVVYSLGLKNVAILDIMMVASGFIIRVAAGGVLAAVIISHWLFIMTFLLALFLAIAKRRDDLVLAEATGTQLRGQQRIQLGICECGHGDHGGRDYRELYSLCHVSGYSYTVSRKTPVRLSDGVCVGGFAAIPPDHAGF